MDGTYEVRIPRLSNYISGNVVDTVKSSLGPLIDLNQVDHVMFCLPPNTARGTNKPETSWLAYALNPGSGETYRTSVYNDGAYNSGQWLTPCAQLSAIMHEIGHNMGLLHSNRNNDGQLRLYQDKSGMVRVGNIPLRFPHIFTQ